MQKAFIYATTVFFCLGVSSAAQAQKTFQSFEQTSIKWHDYFCAGTETPLVGDFNGDGKDDIATFTHGTTADVYVALSDGMKFNGTGVLWNGNICKGTEIPLVGNFNGDKYDDIAIFTRGTTANVFVYLSTGTKFKSPDVIITTSPIGTIQTPWLTSFCAGTQTPLVGDFNGDGMDDIAAFTRGLTADVLVALSDGTKFNAIETKWHDYFCAGTEIPLVGDFNGDELDDIATFTRGVEADVYVALSNGKKFNGTGLKWHDYFCAGTEIPLVGEFNGKERSLLYYGSNGKLWDDIATFTCGAEADVYVAFSDGAKFNGTGDLWNGNICKGSEIPLVGDFNGDGIADIITFTRGAEADVFVFLTILPWDH